jgi:D-alanine-D-alanine ligase-like ATP-grasp enzyme
MLKPKSAQAMFAAAHKLGLDPKWLNSRGLFSVTVNDREQYLYNSFTGLNSQLSGALTKNKESTRILLSRHDMPTIPYLIPTSITDIEDFLAAYAEIVIKPVLGKPKWAMRVTNRDELEILKGKTRDLIVEKFIAGKEVRYLVLKDRIIAVHETQSPDLIHLDTSEIRRISYPSERWNDELSQMSRKIAHIFDLSFCAVDFLVNPEGVPCILEINSCPGIWRFEEPDEGPTIALSGMLLKEIFGMQG